MARKLPHERKAPGPRKGTRYKRNPGRCKTMPAKKPDPLAELPLTRYMDEHFEWMRIKGYTADTVRGRRTAIRRFITWTADRGLTDPREITKPILERYQRHLFYYRKPDGAPLTIGSQFSCLTPLKTFFKWLAKENHVAFNPAADLELPRQPRQLPRIILSVDEVEAILRAADPNTPEGLRDRAMLEVLYSTGLRRMELPNLRRYDVDLTRLVVFVREGKGQKDRVVPIGERAVRWLDKYLVESRPHFITTECEALFVDNYGEPISSAYLGEKVRRYMAEAGLEKPGSCHLFRHACATHMLDNGADIRFIQAMLGHASLSSTERYTHVAIAKLQQIHAATHPATMTRSEEKTARESLLSALENEAAEDDSGAQNRP